MANKVRINEETLRNIIKEAVEKALQEEKKQLDERYYDYYDSGIIDYQGTGSKESKDRVEKIRSKRNKYISPYGPKFVNSGKGKKDDSPYDRSQKLFGMGQSYTKSDTNVCKPVYDFISKIEGYHNPDLDELAKDLNTLCVRWEVRHNQDREADYKI